MERYAPLAVRETHPSMAARPAQGAGGAAPVLPWPAAALTIVVLSGGLWLGIGRLVAALF